MNCLEKVMRILLQRVKKCSVHIDDREYSKIGKGLLLLVGFSKNDTDMDMDAMVKKIDGLRVFEDKDGKMNLSLNDIDGELMIVSQFTLYGSVKKGKRPGFDNAMDPQTAEIMYNKFVDKMRNLGYKVKTGIFGAYMLVNIQNDGPVTFLIESEGGKIK